jgi:O-antigen/teichoic acid export membrane protein
MTTDGLAAEAGAAGSRGRSFASAAVATYATNISVAVLSLANVLIVARALGPLGRGEVAFLLTIAMLSGTLASLGVEEANGNLAGTHPGSRRALASNSLILALLLGALAAAVVLTAMAIFPGVAGGLDPQLRWLAIAAIPLPILQIYLQFLIRADYGFALTNVASLVGPLVTVTVNGLLLALGLITVGTALATWVGAQALAVALLIWYVARRLQGFGQPDARLAARMLGFGVKAHAGRIMKAGNYRLDQWLLGAMVGSRELGLYSIAVAWSEALFYLPEALAMVLRPDVVRATPRAALLRSALIFRAAILLTIPLVAALVVAAPILCVTVFGDSFRGSIDDLRVLAPGAFGMVALKLLTNSLTAQGKPMLGNAAVAVAFIATIGLDILLIPAHGGLGAAIASTAAYTAGGTAVLVIFARTLGGRLGDLRPRRADLVQLSERVLSYKRRAR